MSEVIEEDRNGPGILIESDEHGSTHEIKEGVTVLSTGSTAAKLAARGHVLTVDGTLQGDDYGAVLGSDGTAVAPNRLVVGTLGVVEGGVLAAATYGSAEVVNHGRLLGGEIGLRLNMSGTTLSNLDNFGTIKGGIWGVQTSASGQAAMHIDNHGTIEGGSYAFIDTGGGANHVVNRGLFDGTVSLGSGNDRFHNVAGRLDGTVYADGGDDVVLPGMTREVFDGGLGFDRLDFRSGIGLSVSLSGGAGTGRARGDTYLNFEEVLGSETGDDRIEGDAEVNWLWGFGGRDTLWGLDGEDRLMGGSGRDVLSGGAHNDRIEGGTGADRIRGGAGRDVMHGGYDDDAADVFQFGSASDSGRGLYRDVVEDFERQVDTLDLRGIDADSSTKQVNETFDWTAKSPAAHSVWWVRHDQGVLLRGDVNGNRIADFEILVKDVSGLSWWDLSL